MFQTCVHDCALWLLVALFTAQPPGQTLLPDLAKVSKAVEAAVAERRPGWKRSTVPPATPPGGRPSPAVVIHFWNSEECATAEIVLDGASAGRRPVPCRVKLAIDRSDSAPAALARLASFALDEQSATPAQVGDKAYFWRGSNLVFVKGKFTFWLDVSLELRVGGFTHGREFTEKLAREIGDAVPAD